LLTLDQEPDPLAYTASYPDRVQYIELHSNAALGQVAKGKRKEEVGSGKG
jgi:hypothetical protein